MKLATISKQGIDLKLMSLNLLDIINTPDEIINLHEFCTGHHNEDVEDILDGYECITPAMEKSLKIVYLVRGINPYKAVITFDAKTTNILVYGEDEDITGDMTFCKLEMKGVYQIFDNENEAIQYAEYQYAITRRDELVRQITELNEELSSVMVEVTKGVKMFG